jgi:hypothetical protein
MKATARVVVEEGREALHILRPGSPPEVIPLSLPELAILVEPAAVALRQAARRGERRVRRHAEPG